MWAWEYFYVLNLTDLNMFYCMKQNGFDTNHINENFVFLPTTDSKGLI